MAEARVISQVQIPKYGADGKVSVQTQVTYIIGMQPPRTILIDKAEPTDADIAEAIRGDVAQAPTAGPRTIQI